MIVVLEILKEYMRYVIAAIILILLLVGGSIWMWIDNNGTPIESEYSQEQSEEATASPTDGLNDTQINLVEDYSSEIENFLEILESGAWVSENANTTITFNNNRFFTDPDSEGTPFAIQTINTTQPIITFDLSTPTTQVVTSDVTEITTVAILVDNTSHLIELRHLTIYNPDVPTSTQFTYELSGTIFGQGTFRHHIQSESIDIEGDLSALAQIISEEELEKIELELALYITSRFPTVTTALFTESVDVDFSANTITSIFILDDRRNTNLNVIYDTSTEEIVIHDGSFIGGLRLP